MIPIPDRLRDCYALDLGTQNTSVSKKGMILKQEVLVTSVDSEGNKNETKIWRPVPIPSYIMYDTWTRDENVHHFRKGKILCIGNRAKNMMDRVPPNGRYLVARLVEAGQIVDPEAAYDFIRTIMSTYYEESKLRPKARVIIGVPPEANRAVRKMIVGTVKEAMNANSVIVVSQTMAAAVGCGAGSIEEDESVAICDIGGGTTDISVVDGKATVYRKTLYTGGDKMNEAIVEYVKKKHRFTISATTAERAKIMCGSAIPLERLNGSAPPAPFYLVHGKNHMETVDYNLTTDEIREALEGAVAKYAEEIRSAIYAIPDELIGPVKKRGLVVTGGGALLRGMEEYLKGATGLPILIPEDAEFAVIKGLNMFAQDPSLLNHVKEADIY